MAISKSLRFAILRRDNYTCRYCGASTEDGAKLAVDHIIPVAHGGATDPTNLVAACVDCNAGKAAMPADVVAANEQLLDQMRRRVDDAQEMASLARQLRDAEIARDQVHEGDIKLLLEIWRATFYPEVEPPTKTQWMMFLEKLGYDQLVGNIERSRQRVGMTRSGGRYFFGCCWGQIRKLEGGEP